METQSEAYFLQFEAKATWDRFLGLKERDDKNWARLIRFYGFMILYASAPFTLETFRDTGLVRVWSVGGLWLAITVWFIGDRDFRAYGLHLKERIYCLNQLAVIRSIAMKDNQRYSDETLFPWGVLKRTRSGSGGFPEYLSPSQILTASYFFKFIGGFPAIYLTLFISILLFPSAMFKASPNDPLFLFLRVSLGVSFIYFFWIWSSAKRCLQIQKIAFEARRISKSRPWPLYPTREVRSRRSPGRRIVLRVLEWLAVAIGIANVARGLYLVLTLNNESGYWRNCDVYLVAISLILMSLGFLFSEIDIRQTLEIAREVDPVKAAGST